MSITQQYPQPPPRPQAKDAAAAAAARKRRRRAPAGGAADDCFSCSKKSVKCDRKRPYCSQCLQVGSECSGYKTQLTWGVGVASRGKLRGLSLPVAKSAPASGASQRKAPQRSRSTSSVLSTQWNGQDEPSKESVRLDTGAPSPEHSTSPSTSASLYGYDYLSVSQPDGSSPTTIQTQWNDSQFSNTMVLPESHRRPGTHPGALSITTESRLSPPLDSTSDGYISPMSHTFAQGDGNPYVNSPSIMYDGCTNQGSPTSRSPLPMVMVDERASASCAGLVYAASDHSSSYPSQMDFDAHLSQKLMRECDSLSKTPQPSVTVMPLPVPLHAKS